MSADLVGSEAIYSPAFSELFANRRFCNGHNESATISDHTASLATGRQIPNRAILLSSFVRGKPSFAAAPAIGELETLLSQEASDSVIDLDLKDRRLVDPIVVNFLRRCEAGGISQLKNCPAYIRESINGEGR